MKNIIIKFIHTHFSFLHYIHQPNLPKPEVLPSDLIFKMHKETLPCQTFFFYRITSDLGGIETNMRTMVPNRFRDIGLFICKANKDGATSW